MIVTEKATTVETTDENAHLSLFLANGGSRELPDCNYITWTVTKF